MMEADFVTVVSGVPRSGTSMMMKMLEAGGMGVVADGERSADADNPKGYYEFERVKRLPDGDDAWLDAAAGRAVKIVSALLKWLPENREYRILFMNRDLDEVLASQRRMLENRIDGHDGADERRLRQTYRQHLSDVEGWVERQDHMRMVHVDYRSLVLDAERTLRPVREYLGLELDLERMAGVADPSLYRQRAEREGE